MSDKRLNRKAGILITLLFFLAGAMGNMTGGSPVPYRDMAVNEEEKVTLDIKAMSREQFLKLADDTPFLYEGKVLSKKALQQQEKNFDIKIFEKAMLNRANNKLKLQGLKVRRPFLSEESKLIENHSQRAKEAFKGFSRFTVSPDKFRVTRTIIRNNKQPKPVIVKIYDDYIIPKAQVCILGENLGDRPGKVILTGKFSTGTWQMDILEWTNYKPRVGIVCMLKSESSHVPDHEAKLKIITASGQTTPEIPIRFRATRELILVSFCHSTAMTTKKLRTTLLLPFRDKFLFSHKGWFTSGGSGSDHIHLELINGWEFCSFYLPIRHKHGNGCSISGPYGFVPGSSALNLSFNWSVGWGYSRVTYILEVYIKGPKGIPYRTGCLDCDCSWKVTHTR